ncbi:MAG: hypothetical protein HY760_03620, partial [Nitrospirae bacterium]|nr:hypothetical protein [Nitrospirota bacterium]
LNLNYETVLDPVNALAWFSQDLMEAQKVPFDYYAVMAYHRQIEKETGSGFDETVGLVRRIGETMAGAVSDPSRVLIKIQAVDWETGLPLPPGELKILSERVAMENGVGIAYVFNGYSPPMDLLQGVFSLFGGGAKRGTGFAGPSAGRGGIGGCPEGTPHGPPHPVDHRDLTSR